jgi:hypothetical protein
MWPLLFYDAGHMQKRTCVYVDGFYFYYGVVKGSPYKWLNLKALFSYLLHPRQHDIQAIKYFAAIISGKIDPDQPVRQKTYLRAIKKYIPELSIYYGHFLKSNTSFRKQDPSHLIA